MMVATCSLKTSDALVPRDVNGLRMCMSGEASGAGLGYLSRGCIRVQPGLVLADLNRHEQRTIWGL